MSTFFGHFSRQSWAPTTKIYIEQPIPTLINWYPTLNNRYRHSTTDIRQNWHTTSCSKATTNNIQWERWWHTTVGHQQQQTIGNRNASTDTVNQQPTTVIENRRLKKHLLPSVSSNVGSTQSHRIFLSDSFFLLLNKTLFYVHVYDERPTWPLIFLFDCITKQI